jgi:hypothetical protein
MENNSRAVKPNRTNTTSQSRGQSWHPYREQLKNIYMIMLRRYSDSIPDNPVGRALVDQAIARIRFLARLDKVADCGLREAEIFCFNYAKWTDVGDYTFEGYDPTKPLKPQEFGDAIELTAREKHEWGIKYIRSFDLDPEIEAEKAQRKKEQNAARKKRYSRKRQIEKAKIERQAMVSIHDLAAEGFDNEQIAKAMNALGMRTPSGRGLWREKMVTELIGRDTSAEAKAEAKKRAGAERQRKLRLQQLAMESQQRLKAHANMLAKVTFRIQELRMQGESYRSIARTLTEEGAPTLGKSEWNKTSVRRLLERQDGAAWDKSVTPHVER